MEPVDITHTLICDIIGWNVVSGHVEYVIKCERPLVNYSWIIKRRYNDFFKLNIELLPFGLELNLPPKKTFGNLNTTFIEERKEGLRVFLSKITVHPLLYCSTPVYVFLSETGKVVVDELQQFCLLSLRNHRNYIVGDAVNELGWRYCKKYMNVVHLSSRRQHLYVWMSYGCDKFSSPSEITSTLQFLKQLNCPYLAENYLAFADQNGIGVIQEFWKAGSLRDQLYRKLPNEHFWSKYGMDNECFVLNTVDVKFIARQVLEALFVLHSISYPYFFIHCGNVHITEGGCEISDYEFGLTGQSTFNRPSMIRMKSINSVEDMMVYNFGQLVYEMVSGALVFPDQCAEQTIANLPIVFKPMLQSIFMPASRMPSLAELISDKIFADVSIIRMSQRSVQIPGAVKANLERISKHTLDRFISDKAAFDKKHKNEYLQELMHSDFEKKRRKELVLAQLKSTNLPVPDVTEQ